MSSTIDSRGVVQILFGNNSITSLQSISELYHNSDDSGSTCVNIYNKKTSKTNSDEEDDWFVFEDNGKGMSIIDMENYLKLLNSETKIEKTQHGKYSFGGKQAILQLAGLTTNDKSKLAIMISKQNSTTAVCCEFDIDNLLKYGWENTIKTCSLDDDNTLAAGYNCYVSKLAPEYKKEETHGTIIFIKMNEQLKTIFDDNCAKIINKLSIRFFKCLETCKLYIGESKNKLNEVKIQDPLYYDRINDKYRTEVKIKVYSDGKIQHFIVDGKFLPKVNKLGHTKKEMVKFNLSGFEQKCEIIIQISMIYELIYTKEIDEKSSQNVIYLCRNNTILGTYPKFNYPVHRTAHNENIARWCRVRIQITATNLLDDIIDKLFGINMNKCSLSFASIPKALQNTIKYCFNIFCTVIKPNLLIDFPTNTINKNQEPITQIDIIDEIQEPITQTTIINKIPEPLKQIIVNKHPEPSKQITVDKPIEPSKQMTVDKPIEPSKQIIIITEKFIQEKLQLKEGGRREVQINGRVIDLLTDKYVIEVKRFSDRLDALKVLYYHIHYPDHTARIHLFDHNGYKCPKDDTFESCCKKYNIKLTYEL